jgi:hypothetical protein
MCLAFWVGLAVTDLCLRPVLASAKQESYAKAWQAAGQDPARLASDDIGLVMYSLGGEVHEADGTRLVGAAVAKWVRLASDPAHWNLVVPLGPKIFHPTDWSTIPIDGLLVQADELMVRHDLVMLILLASFVLSLGSGILVIGRQLERERHDIQGVIDTLDAAPLPAAAPAAPGAGPSDGLAAILQRLDDLESRLDHELKDTVKETIRSSIPALVAYLKKHDAEKAADPAVGPAGHAATPE